MKDFFDRAWKMHDKIAGKPAVAFTMERPGETKALQEIERFFNYYKLRKIADGIALGDKPGEKELDACKKLGKTLAESAER